MPIYKTKNKKDGVQQYRVFINYIDRTGKYKKKSKLVYGAAEAKLAEMELQKQLNESVPDAKLTVNELFKEYVAAKKHNVRKTSLDKTESILNRSVISTLGNVQLDKLTTKIMQSWRNEIAEKSLSVITKKNIFSEFRALLNYAVKMEYIERNPISRIENFKEVYFEKPQDKLHYYTPEQFNKYINTALESCNTFIDYAYYVFFNIAHFTGMRKGEINALKWSDIEDDIIHVRRSIAQKLKGGDEETPPKNKSSYRDVQMPKRLKSILQEHKERQKELTGFSEDFRVCGGPNCLRDSSLSNRNIQYADAAKLPHIRIHDFRHSHASLLVNNGINIQEVARRLGHSKIEMTWNTYSHLYPREEDRAIAVLDKV